MDIRCMQQQNLTERGREDFNEKFSNLNHHHHHKYCKKCSPFIVHFETLWAVYTKAVFD